MAHVPVLAIDFDGVLGQYDGWKGEDVLGDPITGAYDFVENIRTVHGWRVIVFSTRSAESLRRWAEEHGFTFDGYNENPFFDRTSSGKPIANAYLDDRGVHFDGNWVAALEHVVALGNQ